MTSIGTTTAQAEQADALGSATSPAVTFSITSVGTGDPFLIGAGDIAGCGSGTAATADILDRYPTDVVQTFGDNAYDHGTLQEFQNCYDPTWGRHLQRTRPVPGCGV